MPGFSFDDSEYEEETEITDGNREKIKKMIHLQSEHRRRAQIQSGFQRIKKELPVYIVGKKISKGDILKETIKYIEHLEEIAGPYIDK